MHYHILLTELCNSECRYCYEKSMKEFDNELDKKFKFDFSSPARSEVNVEKLKSFLLKDKNPVLVFYGGEPLLEIEKIKEIIDALKNTNVLFRMQTNAKLLDKIPIKYLKKIDKILISLDGNKQRTDFNRGKGTYDKVMDNIKLIKEKGFKGELIARMTISQDFPDIYEQVLDLINAGFSSVHWQLDAGFYKSDFNEEKFKAFIKSYNQSVLKLIEYWINEMKPNFLENKFEQKTEPGKVLKLYPFLAIVESLLKNEPAKLRCGAGYSGYAITTNGKIIACPIMNCIENFKAGDLDSSPDKLKKFEIKECTGCEIEDLCGGRCMYWRKAKLWPEQGDKLICDSIKFYIKELQAKLPEIKELIRKKIISEKDFEYEKYFGPEIIP